MKFETVIGLEIHVELATKTKIFCNCENVFGGEENTHCCPVCLGLPGSLPVMNQSVVDYAARVGLALGCEVAPVSYMDRKNYHYPDLPKGYQLSLIHISFRVFNFCTTPFPYVVSPTISALPWFCKTPAKISAADALCPSVSTAIGIV